MNQMEKYLEEIEQYYYEHKLTYEQYRQCIKDVLGEFDEDNDLRGSMTYTIEYQLNKALDIAEKESESRVGFFCHRQQVEDLLTPTTLFGGTFCQRKREWKSSNGGIIHFIDTLYAKQACMGMQFSHIFTNGVHNYELVDFIKSRIRTTSVFTEPIGYYNEFGVTRTESY